MRQIKYIIISFVLLTLSACSSTKKDPDLQQAHSKEKKLEAAALTNTQLGLLYLNKQDIPRAKQKLLLALKEAPKLPEIWYAMGYFLEVTGNKQDARAHYLKAVSLAPRRGDVLNNYGTYLCRSGDYKGAIAQFSLAVKDPGYLEPAAAYENAGLCAMKIPDKTLAANYFRSAIAQDPNRQIASQELAKINSDQHGFTDEEMPGATHASS